jgi:uncharacterized protein involved in exopolysaccharide biosynthesis
MKSLRQLAPYQEAPRGPMRGAAADGSPMRRMPVVNPEQTFFHFDFLRALEMHRGLALGIFLGSLVLAGAYLARRWNTYKADSLVYVQPAPPRLLENGQGQQSWPFDANTYESYIQQQIHNVTREDVLAGAVRRIPDFQGASESEQAAADRLGGNIQVDRVSTGYQIAITATASSPAEAAQDANAVAQSFIDSTTKEMRSGDTQRIALLAEERDRVLKELASDRAEQDALSKQLGVAAVGAATPDPYDDQIAALRAELVKARADNDQAASKLTATAGGGPSSGALNAAADEIVAADPGLVSMKTALNKRRSDLISQMSNLTPEHPLYKQDAQELAKINSSLDDMSKELRAKAATQIEQKLKTDLERTSGVEARLNGQIAQLTKQASGATPRLQRASDLATDISRLQARFTAVDEEYRNLTIDNAAPGAVYLSAPAIAPLHADRKKIYRNVVIVLLMGLVFAVAGALIAHNLDPRIYVAADVERVLGFAPMALLPDLYEVGTGVAEEYMLRLAAAVEHAHQQGHLNSCIFTGVAPGAGATTVSTRVTGMLQAMGRETALVDAVGAPPREDPNAGSELVHLPRGSRSTALLQQMTETNDETVVITDTAPLLISGETEYLARFVDSAIVVIESGTTTRAQLREVAQTLERLDVAAVGFVLNRISLEKGNSAFRHSVRAVEKHLRAQARAFDRQRPRSQAAADSVDTLGRAAVRQRVSPMAPEPVSRPSAPERLQDEPKKATEFSPARETIVVTKPSGAAAGDAAARIPWTEATADTSPGWQTEKPMSPDESSIVPAADAVANVEPRIEEPDSFLPWETQPAARHRALIPRPEPWVLTETPIHPAAEVPDPALELNPVPLPEVESTFGHADAFSSYPPAPQEAAPEPAYRAATDAVEQPLVRATQEPWREAEAPGRGVPDYLRKLTDAVEASAAPPQTQPQDAREAAPAQLPARQDEFETPVTWPQAESGSQQIPVAPSAASPSPISESEGSRSGIWMTAPSKPARGREGVHFLGGRPSAPLTGEEVPNAWREKLRIEAEAGQPIFPLQPQAAVPLQSAGSGYEPVVPATALQEAPAPREPLQAWWEEVAVEQPPAAAAPEPVVSVPAVQETSVQEPIAAAMAQEPIALAAAEAEAAPVSEQDEALYNAASRLSGLRNLLVSLGIQTLHQGAEQRKSEAENEARTPRVPERAIFAQPMGTDSGSEQPADSVTAPPQIIPPRFGTAAAEREKAPAPKTPVKSPRVRSWESPDDVDILPARRGQYRRNH